MNNYQIRTYLLILCSFGCHRICLGQTVATEVGLEGTEIEKEIEMERGLEIRLHNLRMLQTITPGQNSPEIADALKNVGAAYQEIGDAKNAIKYFEDALQMERALYPGQNNINIAETLSNLGSASKQLGNDTLVIKYYEAALEMLRALYPAQNHQAINFALISIGWAYASMGDNAKALHYYEEALKVHKSLQGNYVGTGWILDQICKIYFETRNIEEIINYSEQALEVRKELFSGPNYTFIANSFNNLAFAYEEFGDIYKSAECLKVAFIMDRRTGGGPDTTQSTKRLVEFKYPDFVRNNETREFILQRGTFDKSTLQIKQKLQKTVLNEICKASSEGKWSSGSDVGLEKRGVKDYLDETYLRQQLGSLSNSETVEMAKMLCFEAICLGIMSSASKTKNFQCAREFANAYPAVIEDITKNHPEYFVDGSIVRECTNDPAVLKQMLGSQAAQLGKNALFLTSILCLLFMDV